MKEQTWHALCAVALSLLTIFACGIGSAPLAFAAFGLAVYHGAALLLSLRPRKAGGWACEIRTPHGRFAVAWMVA